MDFVILTEEPIRIDDFLKSTSHSQECGARVWFEGIVRNANQGKEVEGIFYQAYPEMAEKELGKIAGEAKARWPLGSVGIAHRTGSLKVGDLALLVVVQAAHRNEAFAALQFIIDQTKTKVPIWKKEFYEKDSGHLGRWQEPAVWHQ